tara:strand:+ start:886 stop:1332 length:447 start_codon:yes stop_codon:yes gene_type:complete
MPTDANTQIFGGSYGVGFNNVGSYQASARPFIKNNLTVPVTGAKATALEISFPKVSKFVTIRNDGVDSLANCNVKLAFAQGGMDTSNFISIAESASFSADFRITRLYLMSDSSTAVKATVTAGLTQIGASHLTSSWEGLEGIDTNVRS